MKKSDFILIGIVIVVIVIAIFSTKGTKSLDIEYPINLSGEVGLNEITYADYKNLVDSNEPFLFVIEREGCYYCGLYMPIVKEVVEEKKIPVYYVDTNNLTSEEMTELSTTNKYLKKNSDWGTPTTLLMRGEDILDSIGGYVEKEEFVSFLEEKVKMGD